MDLISSRTIDLTSLALNGLSARHKAIASNVANAETPGYKRADVTSKTNWKKLLMLKISKKQ